MDLFDDPAPGGNSPEFTVTELSGAIKRVIEGEFGHVRIRGEVGRVSRPRSGHVYLDLKDDRSVISGVIWKGVTARLETPKRGWRSSPPGASPPLAVSRNIRSSLRTLNRRAWAR